MAASKNPVPVTARDLIKSLRREAAAYTRNTQFRNAMAGIALRDLVECGRVRIVASGLRQAA